MENNNFFPSCTPGKDCDRIRPKEYDIMEMKMDLVKAAIPVVRIEDNRNGLPFFVIRMDTCNDSIHMHDFIQIVYVSKGRIKHVINNNEFELYRGDIFIIPPHVSHYFRRIEGRDFEITELEFIPEFINERFTSDPDMEIDGPFMDFAYLEPFLVSEHEVKPRLNLRGNVQIQVERILDDIIFEYDKKEEGFKLLIKALLLELLVIVGREYGRINQGTDFGDVLIKHRDALERALEFTRKNFAEDIGIEDVAGEALLSQSYFRYLFKQITNKTFTEYLNGLRIAYAKQLLVEERDMKISEVCHLCGFNSINHFNRMFRQETGLTPGQARKKKNRKSTTTT